MMNSAIPDQARPVAEAFDRDQQAVTADALRELWLRVILPVDTRLRR